MNQENNQQQENCSLCESSKEVIKKLNLESNIVNKKKPKFFWKGLIIFGLTGIGVFSIYMFISDFLPQKLENNKSLEIGAIQDINKKNKSQINSLAPDFITEDVFGNKISLNSFRGKKPVLLVFWATWCSYCAKEKEDLKIFTQRYQDKIQVLVVSSGESKQTIADYIQKENINFLILLDEQREIWNQYLVRGTPSHFLIDRDGKIINIRPGLTSLVDLEIMLSMISEQ